MITPHNIDYKTENFAPEQTEQHEFVFSAQVSSIPQIAIFSYPASL